MKKVGLFLLMGVTVAWIAGCGGGGDDDDDFDFNGKWAYGGRVVASNVSTAPVGTTIFDTATVTASGTNFTLDFPGVVPPYVGTCDPGAGTFQARVVWNAITMDMVGHSTDDNAMQGNETWTKGSSRVVIDWAMSLQSRQAAVSPSGSRARLLEVFNEPAGDTH